MNDDIVETVTVDITNRSPAADAFIYDHMLEIHSSGDTDDEQKRGDYD
ncbi:MAG: hypothetical protein P8Z79_14530 [Sedimentisphaerales bacterium]